MNRRTIYVKDQELWSDAENLAKKLGISMSELIAKGLAMALISLGDR